MRFPPLLFAILTLAGAAPPAPQSPGAAENAPFTVAVLRRDGLISPFAAFDGKEWSAPWPSSLQFLDLPISLDAIPGKWWGKAGQVQTMSLWIDGGPRGTVRLLRPMMMTPMCAARLTLLSDYRSGQPVPPLSEQPYPKDGLAVSGSPHLERIEVVDPASPDSMRAATLLADAFAKAEDEAIRQFTDWKHPLTKARRRTVPIAVEALYRAPMDESGWTASYVEAVRRYEPGPEDDGCGLVTFAGGWVLTGPQARNVTRLSARVTYCDRKGVTFMLPLALARAAGRSYWIYQLSGYDREGYAVVRPTSKGVRAEVQYPAGSCPF